MTKLMTIIYTLIIKIHNNSLWWWGSGPPGLTLLDWKNLPRASCLWTLSLNIFFASSINAPFWSSLEMKCWSIICCFSLLILEIVGSKMRLWMVEKSMKAKLVKTRSLKMMDMLVGWLCYEEEKRRDGVGLWRKVWRWLGIYRAQKGGEWLV